jgi:uncharacterized protein (DUF433 family)
VATTRRTKSTSTEIVRNPEIQGGEPTIVGTRVPVRAIVVEWYFERDLDRLCEAYPMVTGEAIQAALAFYEANREEIDRYIVEQEVEFD